MNQTYRFFIFSKCASIINQQKNIYNTSISMTALNTVNDYVKSILYLTKINKAKATFTGRDPRDTQKNLERT
jgi:hypothetical protein